VVSKTMSWRSHLHSALAVGLLVLPGFLLGLLCQQALVLWLSGS
jgi:hypothetical protein